MSQDQNDKNVPREYVAFISYRHVELDKKVAKKIHTMIEHYVIPKELRGEDGNKRLGKVFRDEEELPVSSNLTESIQTALDHSKFLIVICTPDLPKSEWCEREINYFIEKHGREHVVGILVDGTPETSFPKPLTQALEVDAEGNEVVREVEPLAANLTDVDHKFQEKRLRKEAVRLYAALLGCPFDSLWQRERRQKMRKLVALMSLVMVVALAFSVSIYLKNLEISARNKQIEEQNERIQTQNEEIKGQYQQIEEQYREIEEKNSELRLNEALTLLREGELLCEKGDVSETIDRAMRVIASEEGRNAYAADAEWLLYQATGAAKMRNRMRTVDVLELDDDVLSLMVSDDGSRLYAMGIRGYVSCFDVETGDLIWKGDALSRNYHYYVAERQRMQVLSEEGLLLCTNEDVVTALSLTDGSLVWKYVTGDGDGPDLAILSQDQKTLAVIEAEGNYLSKVNHLVMLDAGTGTVRKKIELPEQIQKANLVACGNVCGAFSGDGRFFAVTLYDGFGWSGFERSYVVLADLEEGNAKILKQWENGFSAGIPFTIGVVCHSDLQSVVTMHYKADESMVYVEEIFFSGKTGETSTKELMLPEREAGHNYFSTFVLGDNNGILASCGELTFLCRQDTGKVLECYKYSSENVLVSHWLDHEHVHYSFLAGDGLQYAIFGNAGVFMGALSDKIHLIKMATSKDFEYSTDEVGFAMSRNAVLAVTCDDSLKRIYLQKPSIDPEVQRIDWIKGNEAENDRVFCGFGEDGILSIEQDEDGSIHYRIYQVSTRQLLKDYVLEAPNAGGMDYGFWYRVRDGYPWADGEHLTYKDVDLGYCIYELATKKVTPMFTDRRIEEFQVKTLANGDMLQVALADAENWNYGDEKYSLLIKINDGAEREIPCDESLKWMKHGLYMDEPLFFVGENGYAGLGQYENDEKLAAYHFWNAADGQHYVIDEDVPLEDGLPHAMGKVTPMFAVADEKGTVWIYDVSGEKLKKKIFLQNAAVAGQMEFCNDDTILAVWTTERRLTLYDVATGRFCYEGGFDNDYSSSSKTLTMTIMEDRERNRIFVQLSSDNRAATCVDLTYWKKTADFEGLDVFCPKTNEIYKRVAGTDSWAAGANAAFLCHPAYTLDDLIKKAKR